VTIFKLWFLTDFCSWVIL